MTKFLEFERIQRIVMELKKMIIKEEQAIDSLTFQSGEIYYSGSYFGEKEQYYTLETEIKLPVDWQEETLELSIYTTLTEWDNATNPQMKIYLEDELIQGFDVNHRSLRLTKEQKGLANLKLRIELFSGSEQKKFPLFVKVEKIDVPTYELYYDLYVLLDSWRSLEKTDPNYLLYEKNLGKAVNQLLFYDKYSQEYYHGLNEAKKYIDAMYLDEIVTLPNLPKVSVVGHTHIDLAWLWTVAQAVEKGERSFSTVLNLMECFDDYTFIQSQPQMYDLIKERYPEMYQKIKEKIAEGKWEPEGAMWVEADCNLTSGESLVRQVVYGKRFLKEEFNKESKILWLPDVFGYSAALPQILKKADVPYFMTTKLSWNQYNQIPFDSFYWQGIDGSRVLTHFITTISEGYSPTPFYTTYNGVLDPYTVKKSWERYLDKNINDNILIAYGYGDGGGGPTVEMLEVLERMKRPLPSMPQVIPTTAKKYFDELAEKMQVTSDNEWLGELYFEYHRGTYTSVGKNKSNNRKAESLLQSSEKILSANLVREYTSSLFEKEWKTVLKNQFHDILPGSSIKEVYDQTDEEYALVFHSITEKMQELLTEPNGDGLYVFNPIGHKINRNIILPKEISAVTLNEEIVLAQRTHSNELLVKLLDMPSLGGQYLKVVEAKEDVKQRRTDLKSCFETQDFSIEFDKDFQMVKVYDKKNNREVLPKGKVFNELVVYEDLPLNYDAWEIDYFYKEKPFPITKVIKAEIVERGPIRDTVYIERMFHSSTIGQYIHFVHGNNQILFETKVNWQENHLLLKANFPVDINTLDAIFDIQFGNVKRHVHKNTSWDKAKFEVCGQKWMDMSEGGYGVSLITDSKYGFDMNYKKMGVSLIKSATDPYPEADLGEHMFTYGIYCHEGNWKESKTPLLAQDLNQEPIIIATSNEHLRENSFVETTSENIIIDTLKVAEDSQQLILRSYENENKRTKALFKINENIEKIELCNLLEEVIAEIPVVNQEEFMIEFKPFEIQTVKITLA